MKDIDKQTGLCEAKQMKRYLVIRYVEYQSFPAGFEGYVCDVDTYSEAIEAINDSRTDEDGQQYEAHIVDTNLRKIIYRTRQ
jgi:hypothetical protein